MAPAADMIETPRAQALARAILAPALSAMTADEDVSDVELVQLANACSFSPIFSEYDGETLLPLCETVMDDIAARGDTAVLADAAALLTPELRETAIAYAVRVVLADGLLRESEKHALSGIAAQFEIPDATFSAIVRVIAMLQRSADPVA